MKDLFIFLLFAGIVWLVWQAFTKKSTPPAPASEPSPKSAPPSKKDRQAHQLRNTLQFAKEQHRVLSKKQREQDAWQQRFGAAKASELDELTGVEFEEFLAGLYRAQGYAAEHTPTSGDYGADLILSKDGRRIAVQAKRYVGSVGVQAVQEALSGQAYYQCHTAWVITTGAFTTNALVLAQKSGVKMIGRSEIGNLLAQHTAKTK
ncbi:MAG: restriction endonuclease [Gallionella sp.]|nr:restriction endonuclease [Gallionella sp.]